jgi:hypothetical protein
MTLIDLFYLAVSPGSLLIALALVVVIFALLKRKGAVE